MNSSLIKLVNNTKNIFNKKFGSEPTITSVAPARINIIGEHTDYNDGLSLPFAIDICLDPILQILVLLFNISY